MPTTPRLHGELVREPMLSGEFVLLLPLSSLRHSTSDPHGLELRPSWFAVLTEPYLSSSNGDFTTEGQGERQGTVVTSVMKAGHERDRVMSPSARSSPSRSSQQ